MSQLGTALIRKSAPTFTNFIVVDGTWKEKDTTQHERTDGGDGLPVNYAFWRPGVDASCDLVIKAGASALNKGDVLTESDGEERTFVVLEADLQNFGGKPLKQAVQLAYHVGFTPDIVS
jgi:hypothetical protein